MILSDKLALVSYSFVSMSQFFFIILLISAMILRIPLAIVIIILRPLVPFLKKRLDFERQNLISESAKSHSRAHYCFEVSSEGELEQVRPLIEAVLESGKNIEIIYSSPSVENKCQNFYKTHSSQVKLLRLPLLSGWPFPFLYFQSVWTWVSAPVIVFCRYDFFPELLLLKLFGKKFVLVSGAFKKMSWYKRESFKLFDVVIAATDLEKKNFETLLGAGKKIYSCDFRVPRITERFMKASTTLEKKRSLLGYIETLKAMRPEEKIIMGSVWPSDMQVLYNPKLIADVKAGRRHLLLAPHKLDAAFVHSLKLTCESLFGESLVEVVDDESSYRKAPVVILQMSGILCELYSLFHQTYVGGGYERSIHSVLEPFFSDNMVVTGPLIHRSTEYDLALEVAPDEIHVLNNPDSFYTIIEHNDLSKLKLLERESFRQKSKAQMSVIINEILS